MVNVNKLKGKMVEKCLNVEKLSEIIGMNKATLYRKLAGDGKDITIGEADIIAKALDLSLDEFNAIFFGQYVA